MVDLGFLLITFFVFTTNLCKANAIKFSFPKDGEPTAIAASGSMTIILGDKHQIYYYQRKPVTNNTFSGIKRIKLYNLRKLIVRKKNSTDLKDLMFIIKADKKAKFGDIIDLLDEMIICGIPSGHFAEAELTKEEFDIINLIPL